MKSKKKTQTKKAAPKARKISHAGARAKGHAFERFCAAQFRDHGFPAAARQLEFQIHHANGVDLEGTAPFAVQCKKYAKYVSVNVINEVKAKGIPVLITAGNNQTPMVILPMTDFLAMAEKLYGNKDQADDSSEFIFD